MICSAFLCYGESVAESDRVSSELKKILDAPSDFRSSPVLDLDRLRRFYTGRYFQQVWGDRYGPSYRAQQFRHILRNSYRDGLEPDTYHLSEIDRLWETLSATELAYLDLLITDAFFLYSIDIRRGRFAPFEVDPTWHIPVPEVDAVALLRLTLATDDFRQAVNGLAPAQDGYRRLRDALARYRQLAERGGWPMIPAGPNLKFGMRHRQVAILRQRLKAEDDLQFWPLHDERYFDQSLKYAVERFQVRHGLKMDGIVGVDTREALNVPISTRIEQIELNMERWRWLPRNLGESYIMVNTAGFELTVFENHEAVLSMSVITGTPERPTPATQGLLHTIVLNPYWTVPRTIIFEDLVPEQIRDPHHLESKGIRVFTNDSNPQEVDPGKIDWSEVSEDYFPYILRQDPGPTNPLGHVKILFSNDFDIYLHDTPTRQLFDEPVRALSSGCIRVAQPFKLVSHLLESQEEWSEETIKTRLKSGETLDIPIKERIPVYMVYWTAWVESGNSVFFHDDIYSLDKTNPTFCAAKSP